MKVIPQLIEEGRARYNASYDSEGNHIEGDWHRLEHFLNWTAKHCPEIEAALEALGAIANSVHAWENDTVADELTKLGYIPLP